MTRMAAAILLAAWTTTPSSAAVTAKLASGSHVWLEGDSTLHPYSSTAAVVEVTLTLEPSGAVPQTVAAAVAAQSAAKMTVRIPVKTFKSEHKGLDKNLRKALRAEQHPDIIFVMKGYKLVKEAAATSVVAWGDLSVAGKTKEETLKGILSIKDGRTLIDGEQPLSMTDFGVKPPTMMMGAVKTQDRVVVKFHLELQ